MEPDVNYDAVSVTDPLQVRRARAREVLKMAKGRYTEGHLEILTITRYAPRISHTEVMEIVWEALWLHGGHKNTRRVLARGRVRSIVTRELRNRPASTTQGLAAKVREYGRLPYSVYTFAKLVTETRRRMGITAPRGRPRREVA